MRKITLFVLLIGTTIITNSCSSSDKNEKGKYQCPMQCEDEKVYDKEGKCPVCEMDLEKIEK